MKITITDFPPIAEASIALNGLTVIAGENDTGKSTVGRLLFSLLEAAKWSREEKIAFELALVTLLVQVFGSDSRSGKVGFESDGKKEEIEITIAPGSAITGSSKIGLIFRKADIDTLLIETPLVWQFFDTFQGIAAKQLKKNIIPSNLKVSVPYTYFDVYDRLNGSAVRLRSGNVSDQLSTVRKAVNGRIVFKNNSPRFERGEESFPMGSVATGIHSFGFMQRILELGLARPGFLLILDEPEVHLHPKWQLEYAKLLVNMVKELGMSVLLTSHSAVFVETLEFVGKKKLGDKCKFYLSERKEDQAVVMRDVSDDLEPIYEKLAHPLMQLSLFQGDA